MKQLFILLAVLLVMATPMTAFACLENCNQTTTKDYSSQCVKGSYTCSCPPEGGHNSGSTATSSAAACDSYCQNSTGTATSYSYACSLSGGGTYTVSQGALGSTSGATNLTEAPVEEVPDFIVPNLNIEIPGFGGFSQPTTSADGATVSVNFLAEYINAVYGWVLGAAALVAVVMMMIGGLQYVLSRGKPKYIDKAKTRITNAITGLVLLLAAYNIAYLIDPNTVLLKPIGVQNVEGLEYFPPDGEDDNVTPNTSLDGTTVAVSGNYISAYSGATLDPDALEALKTAAANYHAATGKNIVITSASRDLKKQATLFYNNCLLTGGVCSPTTCNPSKGVVTKSGSKYSLTGSYAGLTNGATIVSAMSSPDHAAYGNCPHTSAIAVDAWCDDGGSNYRHDPACQGQLIGYMVKAGFCRLSVEAWHFELDSKKVSTACSTSNNSVSYQTKAGKTITPTSDCAKWDFRLHYCAVKKN